MELRWRSFNRAMVTQPRSKSIFHIVVGKNMDGKKPCILIIDDNTDQVRADFAITMEDDVIANVLHPDEIKSTHLEGANLVLVDYRLDKWRKRDSQSSVAFQLRTGMALAVVLREYN